MFSTFLGWDHAVFVLDSPLVNHSQACFIKPTGTARTHTHGIPFQHEEQAPRGETEKRHQPPQLQHRQATSTAHCTTALGPSKPLREQSTDTLDHCLG